MGLKVEITGDASSFKQTLEKAKLEAKGFADHVSGEVSAGFMNAAKGMAGTVAGFLGIEAVWRKVEGLFERGKIINELSEQFELGTDTIQKWQQALGRAGLSIDPFLRAMEQLRQKRQEAREDPSKRGSFASVGMLSQALDYNVSDEQLFMQVLQSPNASRVDLRELLGKSGPRLKAALPTLAGETPALSPPMLRDISQGHAMMKSVQSDSDAGAAVMITHPMESLAILIAGVTGDVKSMDEIIRRRNQRDHAEAEATKNAPETKLAKQREEAINDRMNTEREQAEIRQRSKAGIEAERAGEAADQRLREAKRGTMTRGQAKTDIQREIGELDEKIDFYSEMAKTSLSPAGKARAKTQATELEARKEQLQNELREAPIKIPADSLAKSGLYSAAALNAAPGMTIQQEQLQELKGIRGGIEKIRTEGGW